MILPKIKDYPNKIKVGKNKWDLKVVDKVDDANSYGHADLVNKEILIRKNQNKTDMFKTFWHEVIHAFEEEYGFRLSHRDIFKLETALAELCVKNLSDFKF